MMTISRFKSLIAALMLAFTFSVAFSACSSSEEEDTTKDEICDEADAGAQGCPD